MLTRYRQDPATGTYHSLRPREERWDFLAPPSALITGYGFFLALGKGAASQIELPHWLRCVRMSSPHNGCFWPARRRCGQFEVSFSEQNVARQMV